MQRLRVTQMQMHTDKFWDISCFSANILHTYYVMEHFMNNLLNSYQEQRFFWEIGIEAQNITNCLLKIAFFFSTGKSLCALLVLNPSKRFPKYKNIQQQQQHHHASLVGLFFYNMTCAKFASTSYIFTLYFPPICYWNQSKCMDVKRNVGRMHFFPP